MARLQMPVTAAIKVDWTVRIMPLLRGLNVAVCLAAGAAMLYWMVLWNRDAINFDEYASRERWSSGVFVACVAAEMVIAWRLRRPGTEKPQARGFPVIGPADRERDG